MRENIEFDRIGEYHLGPTGAKGWMHVSKNFMTGEARQILITQVAPGTPADGVLQAGDLIFGIGGKHFTSDARKSLGAAIDEAEQEDRRMSDGTQGITTSLDAPDHIGAVAVVGGGIGGMQASLDLAESGFKVYLIEKESSIGGRMAQLDKTFPTNDCAM